MTEAEIKQLRWIARCPFRGTLEVLLDRAEALEEYGEEVRRFGIWAGIAVLATHTPGGIDWLRQWPRQTELEERNE